MRLALSDALGSARLPTLTPDGALTSTHRNRTDHPKVFPGFLPESRTRRLARLRRLEPKVALGGVSESRSGESPAKTLFFANRDHRFTEWEDVREFSRQPCLSAYGTCNSGGHCAPVRLPESAGAHLSGAVAPVARALQCLAEDIRPSL